MSKNFSLNILITLIALVNFVSSLRNSTHIRKYARRGQYPSVVSIQNIIEKRNECFGILITIRHVLSVAHCFPIEEVNHYVIVAGMVHLKEWDDGCQTRSIVKIIRHYGSQRTSNPYGEDDIAVYFLDHDMIKTYFVIPSYPQTENRVDMYDKIEILAWGVRNVNQTYSTRQLEYTNAVVQEFCGVALHILSEKIICLEAPQVGDFRFELGNGGAPAFIGDKVIGLATNDFALGTVGVVYLNISYYDPWIKSAIRDHRAMHIYGATLAMFVLCMGMYILIFVLYSMRNKF